MRFREKDKRGLRPSAAERPKGKTQIIIILFVAIVLTPDGRSDAESDFHSVGACSGHSFGIAQRNRKARRVLNDLRSGRRH